MKCSCCDNELTDDMISAGICFNCGQPIVIECNITRGREEEKIRIKQEQTEKLARKIEEQKKISSIILTTTATFEGRKITRYLALVSGEIIMGTGIVSQNFAEVSNFFGTQSNAMSEKVGESQKVAIYKMKEKAFRLGADAVVGVRFSYITFSNSIIGVIVNGTAVQLMPIENLESK